MFEVHMTFEHDPSVRINTYYNFLRSTGAKIVSIANGVPLAVSVHHMTSCKLKDMQAVKDHVQAVKTALKAHDVALVRVKVERCPNDFDVVGLGGKDSLVYFETHYDFYAEVEKACDVAKVISVSRNLGKPTHDGKHLFIATLRSVPSGSPVPFESYLHTKALIEKKLASLNVVVEKVVDEVCIYDTNPYLDQSWMAGLSKPRDHRDYFNQWISPA